MEGMPGAIRNQLCGDCVQLSALFIDRARDAPVFVEKIDELRLIANLGPRLPRPMVQPRDVAVHVHAHDRAFVILRVAVKGGKRPPAGEFEGKIVRFLG